MADTISRQEAVDSATPDFHKQLEQLTGGPMIVIVIAVNPDGLSIVGNVMPDGIDHYLQQAIDHVNSGVAPVITEVPDKKVN